MSKQAIEFIPWHPKAQDYALSCGEFGRYRRCAARWAEFFFEQSRQVQEEYEAKRKALLKEKAKANRAKPTTRKFRVKKTNKEALQKLIDAGLSPEMAKSILH